MSSTKKTHIEIVKQQTVGNEQLIQALFDLTEDQYSQYKFNAGIEYANRMTFGDEMGFDLIVKTRFYWQWWKNEWAKRDADFLDTYSATAEQSALYDQYLFAHSIYRLNDDKLMSKKAISMVGFAVDEYMKNRELEVVR